MYVIRIAYANGTSSLFPEKVIHDPANDIFVHSATLTMALNEAGSLTFETDITHQYASWMLANVMTYGWFVHVEYDSSTIWTGRIASATVNRVTGFISVYCEGLLATLNDGVTKPYAYSGSPTGLLEELLVYAGNSYDYEVGSVTVTDPNGYIVRSNDDYNCAWDEISSKTAGSSLGGYLFASWNDSTHKVAISWLESPGTTGSQPVQYAQNLLDLEDETDGTDLYSGIKPYGALLDDSTSPPTYVTLESLSDTTIGNVDIVGNYGWAIDRKSVV